MQKSVPTPRKRSALGQGLSALIPLKTHLSETDRNLLISLPIDTLHPNPNQPRSVFPAESLEELAESIREKGIIQPLIVRPTNSGSYEIVAGERRWRAARMAGYSMIPSLIKDVSDAESLEFALIENIQREDLNALDTAEAYEKLLNRYSYTQETLSRKIGKDRSSITNYLRLLKLPDPIKQLVREEKISLGHAKALLSLEDVRSQLAFSLQVVRKRMSVRELEKIVQNYKRKKVSKPKLNSYSPMETALSRFLSTKVTVHFDQDESGKLQVFFHNRAELSRILDMIGFKEDFS